MGHAPTRLSPTSCGGSSGPTRARRPSSTRRSRGMHFEYVDVIYANPPEGGLTLEELVDSVADLIATGRARAWAVVNWTADMLLEASTIATRKGLPQPCAAQLPYSLVHRSPVEDASMLAALDACGAGVVASFVLAGGVLTGKYDQRPECRPRGRKPRASARLRRPWPRRGARGARTRARHDAVGAGDRVHARQPGGRERALRLDLARTGASRTPPPWRSPAASTTRSWSASEPSADDRRPAMRCVCELPPG